MATATAGALGSSSTTMAPLAWHEFLERMSSPSASEFVKSIKSFIVSFSNSVPDPEKDSAAVQEFLAKMEGSFRSHNLWAGSSEEELQSAGELAQKELQKLNMYKAPRDKLVCILNCCKVINDLLLNVSMASNDNPPGADNFLPVLIYVTIKTNPQQLHSNLLYIQRYRHQSRLVSETAYFFTNILSAESFIWNIDAQSLSMDEMEFQKKMESAKANLLGLSTHTESQRSETNQEFMAKEEEAARDTERDTAVEGHHKPSLVHEGSKDLGQGQSVRNLSSISNLEEEGTTKLLKDDQLSKYFQEYPYLYADAGDLTIDDVESLLNSYKKLVLMYASLSKAASVHSSFATPSTLKEENILKNSEG